MGLPILLAVYSSDHQFLAYLYVTAIISLLIYNPAGFVLMEISKKDSQGGGVFKTILKVLKNLAVNPIIICTVLGIIGNFALSRTIPHIVFKFLDAIGKAYGSAAPFCLGLSLVGKGNFNLQLFQYQPK